MRIALWAPALASTAAALAGRSVSSTTVIPTATPISSSTPGPISSDAFISSQFEQGSMKRVCQNEGDPAADWQEFKMGEFLNQTSSQWCSDPKLFSGSKYDISWPRKLSSLLPQNEKWHCYATTSCDIPKNVDWCDDNRNAQVQFALYSVLNFHDWMKILRSAIQDAGDHFSYVQTDLVTTFTTHDIDNSNPTADGLSIGAAVMGVVGALAGGAGPAGKAVQGVAGVVGAGLGLGSSIAALDTPNPAEVLQKEMDTLGDMGELFGNGFKKAKDYYRDLAAKVLQDIPEEDCESYVDTPESGPAILSSGIYSGDISYSSEKQARDLAMVLTDTAAVGFLWKTEEIYIAKLTKQIDGMDPCDAYHDFEDLWGACDDSTGTLYLFAPWKYTKKTDEWDPVPGIEDVADFRYDPEESLDEETYHVDLLSMARAAEINQQTNGYNSSGSPSTMMDSLQSEDGGIENALPINLPVCYLDNIIDHYLEENEDSGKETVVKDALSRGCASIPNNIKHWPYEYKGDPKEPATYFNQNPEVDDAKDSIVIDGRGYVIYPNLDEDWWVYWD